MTRFVIEKPPTPKPKSHVWPPQRPIEEITYPTASPLYIDPNPALDRRAKQNICEKRSSIEGSSRDHSRRNSFTENFEESRVFCQFETKMDQVSCPGPVYRRVELFKEARKDSRQTRCDSREGSTDGVRRSLTPTRITQPIPRPWTATVTTGANLYQQAYPVNPPEPPKPVCSRTVCRRQICRRECVCDGESGTQTTYEERRDYQEQICQPEQRVETPKPDVEVHACVRLPNSHSRTMESKTKEISSDSEIRDLSKLVPPDVAVCPKGIDGEHDLYTEMEEEDVGNLHIKKTTTYEKTVELVSPDREIKSSAEPEPNPQVEKRHWEQTCQRLSSIDREVENISCHRNIEESTEMLTSTIDTQQMMEQAKRDDEEAQRRKEEYERNEKEERERKQREEEERKRMAAQERKRKQDEERRLEQQRQEVERCRQEEGEKRQKRVCFSEEREFICEHTCCPQERIIDIQLEGPKEHIIDIDVEGRPKEHIIDVKLEQDEPCCQCREERFKELREEIKIQKNFEQQDLEAQRRRSLREQVQVHKSLRDQQTPERRQTLQERRLCTKYGPKTLESQGTVESCRKQVQFINETDSGSGQIPSCNVQNTIPKEWKSEMVKALTTAPDQSYYSLGNDNSVSQEIYTSQVTYKETCQCNCEPSLPPIPCPHRPVSPFQSALTTAPERPYSPLGGNVNPCKTCCRRSQTPTAPSANDGYCAPAQLLFSENKEIVQERKKPQGPQPLPIPPSDYRLRDSSKSPSRSRPGTPGNRSMITGLKKPDTIPLYQKHLVAMKNGPVESNMFDPSRTPTPCSRSKSPMPKTEQECVCYHYEEDTPSGHAHKDIRCTKCVSYSEDEEGTHTHIREQKVQKITESPASPGCCVSRNSSVSPSLPCPSTRESVSERIQRQGVRVLPPCNTTSLSTEVRRIRHEIVETPPKLCPNTGVTVVPCRTVSENGSKTGVVVLSCDGSLSSSCDRSGVCVTPTMDRQGVCVSPATNNSETYCKQPSGVCGVRSGGCSIDAGTCSGSGVCVTPCGDGSFCVAPCSVSGKSVSQCTKSILKSQCEKNIPFPQIPLPNEEAPSFCSSCPFSQSEKSDVCSSFESKLKPRTNLSNQLTQLTLNRIKPPTVQLYKPQAQICTIKSQSIQSQSLCQSKTQSSHQSAPCCPIGKPPNLVDPPKMSSQPNLGAGVGGLCSNKSGSFAGSSAPKRGKGILNQAGGSGSRVPQCARCNNYVRYWTSLELWNCCDLVNLP